MLVSLQKFFEVVLEYFVVFLMIILTVVVIVAVLYRLMGSSLAWYDEVAAILLAWITYYGSALAVLRRRHIGFDSVLLSFPNHLRMVAVAVAELITAGFFILLAWAGFTVMAILGGMSLVSVNPSQHGAFHVEELLNRSILGQDCGTVGVTDEKSTVRRLGFDTEPCIHSLATLHEFVTLVALNEIGT